ncbi:hypothetical protein PF005_g5534, partial [Phytophthora fragariae]
MSDTRDDMLAKFKTFLEQEDKPSTPDGLTTAARRALIEFWGEMRGLLAVNDASRGLDQLDNMASALIEARGRAAATLRDPILILPSPTRQSSTVGALPHPSFTSDAVPKKRAAAAAPANASKAKKQRASTGSAKKSKPSSSSSTETPTPSPPQLDFDLAPDTPVDVRRAIETIYVKASAAQRAPYQLVFLGKTSTP